MLVKSLACILVVCGVTVTPYIYSSNIEIPQVEEKKKSVKLGKSIQGKANLSLGNIKNINQLLKGEKTKLSFKEIGMKFGDKDLQPDDILFNPCDDEVYYLFKAISASRNQYQLEDGTPAYLLCRNISKYKHLNSVRIDWARPSRWSLPTSLTVGSCNLFRKVDQKKPDNPKLQIVCTRYKTWGDRAVGEFGDDSFEYEQQ